MIEVLESLQELRTRRETLNKETPFSISIAKQLGAGGAIQSGVSNLAAGASRLSAGVDKLDGITLGIGRLSGSLNQMKEGASKLTAGSGSLTAGLDSSTEGSSELLSGTKSLSAGAKQLQDGSEKLLSGAGKLGQKDEIVKVMDHVSADKDQETAQAFSKTFSLAAIILIVTSIFGLFTDKKKEKAAQQQG